MSKQSPLYEVASATVAPVAEEHVEMEREKLKTMLFELWVLCESQRQMHRLSHEFFKHLDFWCYAFPLIIITMATGVLGFLTTVSDDIISTEKKTWAGIGVGFLAILSIAWQQVGKTCNYGTRAELHKQAYIGMKKLTDDITFAQIDPESGVTPKPHTRRPEKPALPTHVAARGGNKQPQTPVFAEHPEFVENDKFAIALAVGKTRFYTYQELYNQCLETCTSTIPISISQAFMLLESRLRIYLDRKKGMEALKAYMEGEDSKQRIYSTSYNELYCQFTQNSSFPLRLMSPYTAVNNAMLKVQKLFAHADHFFNEYEYYQDKYQDCLCCLVSSKISKAPKNEPNLTESTNLVV